MRFRWDETKKIGYWYSGWRFWYFATGGAAINLADTLIGQRHGLAGNVIITALLPGLFWLIHRMTAPPNYVWQHKERLDD